MSRRAPALRSALVALLLAAFAPSVDAAPEVAWDVRVLTAPWRSGQAERVELLMDAGSDPLERQLGIRQGAYLRHVTGLPLGQTEEIGSATVVFPLGEAFTIESAGDQEPFKVDVDPRKNESRPGFWDVDLKLAAGKRLRGERTIPLHPHRARLWLVPRATGVLAVLIEAWPAKQSLRITEPQDTVDVDFAVVRGAWRRGGAPSDLKEADFPSWLDPFELEPGESAAALMRPVSAGAADAGTLLFTQSFKVPLGDLTAYERGQRPDGGGEASDDFLSATISFQEVEDGAARLNATLSVQSGLFGAPEFVMLRRFVMEDGATHCWIVPTDDSLNAVFIRAKRGRRSLVHPVRPGS